MPVLAPPRSKCYSVPELVPRRPWCPRVPEFALSRPWCPRRPEFAPSWVSCPPVPEPAPASLNCPPVPPWKKSPTVPEPRPEIDESAELLPLELPRVWRRASGRRLHARTWGRPTCVLEVDWAHGYAVNRRREAWMRDPAPRPSPCRRPAMSCLQAASEPRPETWMNASSRPSAAPAVQGRHDPLLDSPSTDYFVFY